LNILNSKLFDILRRSVPAATLCFYFIVTGCTLVSAGEGLQRRAREVRPIPAGEVVVILNEQLFNALLDAMLSQDKPPTYPLAGAGRINGGSGGNGQSGNGQSGNESGSTSGTNSNCASAITLLREAGGTRTAVRFSDGRIVVPVAFRGSYEAALLGCVSFEGWADAEIVLRFDPERQALNARVLVRRLNLKDFPAMMNGVVTEVVQRAIDQRLNPIEILRAEQLAARLPVTPGNALKLRAREIKHEVVQQELRLRIFYEVVPVD